MKTCSGCQTPGTRIDRCVTCNPNGPHPNGDARRAANLRTHGPRLRKAQTIPALPPKIVGQWSLWFVPFDAKDPTLLDRFKTADEGMKVAATHNSLDWMPHEALGADALIAMGKKGSFILEPMTR